MESKDLVGLGKHVGSVGKEKNTRLQDTLIPLQDSTTSLNRYPPKMHSNKTSLYCNYKEPPIAIPSPTATESHLAPHPT